MTDIPYWFLYLCFGGLIFVLGLFAKAGVDKLFSKSYNGDERRKVVTFTIDEEKLERFLRVYESHAVATQAVADGMNRLTDKIEENNRLITTHTLEEAGSLAQIADLHRKLVKGIG